jgi:hypothetical protein
MIPRRTFISLIGGAVAAWPLAARAQREVMPVIGFLNGGSPEKYEPFVNAFLQGLKETGYSKGLKRRAIARAKTSRSNTVGRTVSTLGSPRWLLILFAVRLL